MIKKKIIFIIVFVVILCAIVGFVVYSIVSTNMPQNDNSNTNDKNTSEEKHRGTGYIFELDCEDISIFEGTSYSFSKFILTNDIAKWNITASVSSNKVHIDMDNLRILGNETTSGVQVELSAEPTFDISKDEDWKDAQFPIKDSFIVSVLPNNIDLNYEVETIAINEFNIKISSSNYSLKKENFRILNLNDFTIANITLSNSNVLTLKSVNIKNALGKTLNLSYEEVDDNQTKRIKNIGINLNQDDKFIAYSWNSPIDFDNTLYVTKDNEYSEEYPNKANLIINNNFDLELVSSGLIVTSGNPNGLLIEGLTINAREVGNYEIDLVIEGKVIDTFMVEVKNIEVDQIEINNLEVSCYVDENLLLVPHIVKVIASKFAVYELNFEILNNSEFASISNNIFVARSANEYNIKVCAGNKEKNFTIIVKEKVIEYFALLDERDKELDEINISLTKLALNPEISICFKYKFDSYSKYPLICLSDCENVILCEIYANNNLSILLNRNNLVVGDSIDISIKVSMPNEEDDEIWNIKLNIID